MVLLESSDNLKVLNPESAVGGQSIQKPSFIFWHSLLQWFCGSLIMYLRYLFQMFPYVSISKNQSKAILPRPKFLLSRTSIFLLVSSCQKFGVCFKSAADFLRLRYDKITFHSDVQKLTESAQNYIQIFRSHPNSSSIVSKSQF